MKLVNILKEGDSLPNGLYIKIGLAIPKITGWEPWTQRSYGPDGLVESIYYYERPTGEYQAWVTLGFRFGPVHWRWRIRPWATNYWSFTCRT